MFVSKPINTVALEYVYGTKYHLASRGDSLWLEMGCNLVAMVFEAGIRDILDGVKDWQRYAKDSTQPRK